ncbi:MAG: hypothetical protein R3C61_28425 [Bacteroidia bacterium]
MWGTIGLGFNLSASGGGQEADGEVYGTGNAVSYKYRVEDPRLGRFWSVDPLSPKYPFYSPYAFSGNRVLDEVELEGAEPAKIPKSQGDYDIAEDQTNGGNYRWIAISNANAKNFEESLIWERRESLDFSVGNWRPDEMFFADGETNFDLGDRRAKIMKRIQNNPVEHFEDRVTTALTSVSGGNYKDGLLLFTRLGSGEPYLFPDGSDLSIGLAKRERFLEVVLPFEDALRSSFVGNGSLSHFDGNTNLERVNFGGNFLVSFFHNASLTAFMGNTSIFSASVISMKELENSFSFTINYRLGDHFSAGRGDHNRNLMGLQSMYILQHFINQNPEYKNAYRPFMWEVEVQRTINIPKK